MSKIRRVLPLLAAASAAWALAACGEDDPIGAAQDAARNAGEQVERKAYETATVAALAAIDPDLAADPSRALIQAKAACAVIENENTAKATTEVRKRFGTSSVRVNDATAKQIIRVLKKDLCPRL